MPGNDEIGLWFTTNPTAVISTYLTDDPMPVPMDHADLADPGAWPEYTDRIDFCVITVSNYRGAPGINNNDVDIEGAITELQAAGVDVYIAVTCLLGTPEGDYKMMVDGEDIPSRHWYRPTDDDLVIDLSRDINRYCERFDPTGVLLWYATFPNENYCFKSDCKNEETGELDIDDRAAVLTGFLEEITDRVRAEHSEVRIGIEIDVRGAANIKYRHGVELSSLEGVVDEVFLHVLGKNDETIKRAVQIASRARKHGIKPRFYMSLMHEQDIETIYNPLMEKFPTSLLVYSSRKQPIEKAIDKFLTEKWEPYVNGALLAGSLASVLLGIGEFAFGLTLPFGKYSLPGSVLLATVLLVLSYREEKLPVISQTLAHHVSRRPW